MKRTREERIATDSNIKSKIKELTPHTYLCLKYVLKNKNGESYITGSGKKWRTKSFAKKESSKAIRNYTKNQWNRTGDIDSLKTKDTKKLFDYWWTLL